jgi:outer membrane protein insertion porin family
LEKVKLYKFANDSIEKEINKESIDSTKVKDKDNIIFSNHKDRVASLFTSVAYDSLDYKWDPTKGNRQEININFACSYLGGQVNYLKTILRSSWYFPVFWKIVFDASLQVGAVASYGSSKVVPIYERFYIGGSETVRGYKYRKQIGPVSGGNYEAVLNIEFKFPIISHDNNSLIVGAFLYDIGGDWGKHGSIKWLGTGENNLRSSAGFELRIISPVLPLAVGWAYGFNHKAREKKYDVYLSMSYPI